MAMYIATAVSLAIVTAVQFGERALRYKRIKERKAAGTMGFEYESSGETEEDRRSSPI